MSLYTSDMYSSEYNFSDEELELIEMISRQYDEMLALEVDYSPQIGYCGFECDYECYTCNAGSYDITDEY